MDFLEVEKTRKAMLDEIDDFSKEIKNYYDTLETLTSHPLMKGEFLDRAKNLTEDIKVEEEKIKTNIEELITVIEGAIMVTESTEVKFFNKFKEIASNDFKNWINT